jgi:hypothetical protein
VPQSGMSTQIREPQKCVDPPSRLSSTPCKQVDYVGRDSLSWKLAKISKDHLKIAKDHYTKNGI